MQQPDFFQRFSHILICSAEKQARNFAGPCQQPTSGGPGQNVWDAKNLFGKPWEQAPCGRYTNACRPSGKLKAFVRWLVPAFVFRTRSLKVVQLIELGLLHVKVSLFALRFCRLRRRTFLPMTFCIGLTTVGNVDTKFHLNGATDCFH